MEEFSGCLAVSVIRIRIHGISGLALGLLLLQSMFVRNLLAISSFVLYNRDGVQSLRDLRDSV